MIQRTQEIDIVTIIFEMYTKQFISMECVGTRRMPKFVVAIFTGPRVNLGRSETKSKEGERRGGSRQTCSRPSSLHLGHARGPPSVPLPLRREHRPTRSINQAFAPKELPPGDVKVSPRPRATKIDSRAGVGERGHQVAHPRLAAAPPVIAPSH